MAGAADEDELLSCYGIISDLLREMQLQPVTVDARNRNFYDEDLSGGRGGRCSKNVLWLAHRSRRPET